VPVIRPNIQMWKPLIYQKVVYRKKNKSIVRVRLGVSKCISKIDDLQNK